MCRVPRLRTVSCSRTRTGFHEMDFIDSEGDFQETVNAWALYAE